MTVWFPEEQSVDLENKIVHRSHIDLGNKIAGYNIFACSYGEEKEGAV